MNSKKKNKNKQNKPTNPTPPQKKEDVTEPVSAPEEVVESIEDRVPNIVSENVPVEVKESEETPKKPKRNRGKKKKEDEKSDKEDDVKVEDPKPVVPGQAVEEVLSEVNIAPTARKKKNKNKKSQEPAQDEKSVDKEIRSEIKVEKTDDISQEAPIQKVEEIETETKSSKKKSKKKKNRNDSEKSDKDEVSCTSAFQQLLVEDIKSNANIQTSTTVDNSDKEIVTPQVIIPAEIKLEEDTTPKEEVHKNKKKNKKDKKYTDQFKIAEDTPTPELTKSNETVILDENVEMTGQTIVKNTTGSAQIEESSSNASATEPKSPKLKAKIAKPVEKKKKGTGDAEKTFEEKPEYVEEAKITEVEFLPVGTLSKNEVSPSVALGDIELQTEISPNWLEEVKTDDGIVAVIGSEPKNEKTILLEPNENLEKNKKRKKSPKPSRKTVTPVIENPNETTPEIPRSDNIKCVEDTGSGTSVEKTESKYEVTCEVKPDIISKELPLDDKMEHIKGVTENERKQKGKGSPKPQRKNEFSAPEIISNVASEAIKIDKTNVLKIPDAGEKETEQLTVQQPVTIKEEACKDEIMCIQNPDHKKRKNSKKSPKPQKKIEFTTSEITANVASEAIKIGETNVLTAISVPSSRERETEQLAVQQPVTDVKEEARKDEIMSIQNPDYEKRQKSKKSPKSPINIEVASGSKGNTKKNAINIDDIIIIQAEVVEDEKSQECDTFIASEENITSQDESQDTEVKPGNEKYKKGKKSKTTKKEMATDFKTAIDPTEIKDSQAEIQMPVTPMSTDINLLPDTIPVELEVRKAEPMPSPNDLTPDFIEYPRCSSEQLLDNNNNTVIQEISNVETKLEVPIVIPDTPFIRSTDLLTPESAASEIKVAKVEPTPKSADEKTDLKSKVMEVNQDMEELRLSIEKSLAELTSLDKKDTEVEKKMQEESKKDARKAEQQDEVSVLPEVEQTSDFIKAEVPIETKKTPLREDIVSQGPVCPERKDRKGKGKSKKGKQEVSQISTTESTITSTTTTTDTKEPTQSKIDKKEESNKSEQKTDKTQEKGKQQSTGAKENKDNESDINPSREENTQPDFEPIENFEDAMTSSVDDVNKTFEIIANEANARLDLSKNNPEINIIAPQEDDKGGRQEKQNPVSPPKNLLGHPDIPVPSSRTDYKKEKNKTPNYRQAKVKIKDVNDDQIESPEKSKQSKESQTENKRKFLSHKSPDESICVTNKNEDYIYKYSFRKVFLQCACHVCKKDLTQSRVPCSFCNLIFYCNQKHKDEDYAQHQALCFAVSTIVHLKDQKFIYADARNVTGHNYRLLRMQMIVSSEKVLKRRLVPWEQEALLYPRICADAGCREWRQGKLEDCEGCGQISYCSDHPEHFPKTHARWCKSYNLYRSLVRHQQTQGRLEPKLPTRIVDLTPLPENINEVLANMYEERIDMSDIEYAALTQLATAPLTALYCLQAQKLASANGVTKKSTLTLHIVGAELQFEADVLNKWEVFLLHLMPHVWELRVVLVGPDLNPSNLPLELLGKIKLCENCRQKNRRVVFNFQDKSNYHEFWASEDFTTPDLVCAFNPSIQRSSTYNGRDSWPSTINCILKLKIPFAITSHTLSELASDLLIVQECGGHSIICSPKTNSFSSVRPDRNFISDDEAPLLFKNHCVAVICGV